MSTSWLWSRACRWSIRMLFAAQYVDGVSMVDSLLQQVVLWAVHTWVEWISSDAIEADDAETSGTETAEAGMGWFSPSLWCHPRLGLSGALRSSHGGGTWADETGKRVVAGKVTRECFCLQSGLSIWVCSFIDNILVSTYMLVCHTVEIFLGLAGHFWGTWPKLCLNIKGISVGLLISRLSACLSACLPKPEVSV